MKPLNHLSIVVCALSAAVTLACAPAPRVAATPAVASAGSAVANTPPTANDVKWSRTSAEYRAIFIETYRAAGERLATLSSAHQPASWGVILDADETVLDNSEYEVARIPFGGSFDAAEWTKWVMQGRAPALPGAVAFTSRVHELGGKVVIVTNRDDAECPITRTNLERSSIRADLVLCKTTTGDKNPRFDAVQNGTAAPGVPALAILEWVGDNIQDFPHLKQSIRDGSEAGFSRFGDSFFALPNPMYGSWQANPLK